MKRKARDSNQSCSILCLVVVLISIITVVFCERPRHSEILDMYLTLRDPNDLSIGRFIRCNQPNAWADPCCRFGICSEQKAARRLDRQGKSPARNSRSFISDIKKCKQHIKEMAEEGFITTDCCVYDPKPFWCMNKVSG